MPFVVVGEGGCLEKGIGAHPCLEPKLSSQIILHVSFLLHLSFSFSSSPSVYILKCESHWKDERLALCWSWIGQSHIPFAISFFFFYPFHYHTNLQHSTTFDIHLTFVLIVISFITFFPPYLVIMLYELFLPGGLCPQAYPYCYILYKPPKMI